MNVNGALNPALRALSVHRSTGSGSRDRAVIQVDLSDKGTETGYIGNVTLNSLAGAAIEVYAWPLGVPVLIHSGVAVAPSIKITDDSEQLTFVSRVEPWQFGVLMNGIFVWEPLSSSIVTVLDECTFNPEIDDATLANQSNVFWQNGLAPVFLDPESTRTAASQTLQGGPPAYWSLQTALAYLCWALNPNETFVRNPSAVSLSLLPTWPLQNFFLKRGKFLNEYLDEILPRHGLLWYLDLSKGFPQIAFRIRGLGLPNTVYLGTPGSSYSGDNLLDGSLDYDVGNVKNQVVIHGDWLYVESTFVLSRGWSNTADSVPESSLSKDSTDYNNPGKNYTDVWRTWTLNEAGDYIGLRPEITAAYNLSTVFGADTVPRRRKFLPVMTLASDGTPLGETAGCAVEYSTDGGATWFSICQLEDRTCVLLERECGIRFDGLFPPAELVRAGSQAQVRITATVRSDIRLAAVVGPDGNSPLAFNSAVFVDESKKYHWRVVSPTSKNFANLNGQGLNLKADTADDTAALLNYAAWLQDTFDVADVPGQFTVEGLDTFGSGGPYDLGQVLTAITGRNIGLNTQSPSSGEGRFPQIIGIDYDCQAQKRTLHLETFRDEGHLDRHQHFHEREGGHRR